MGIGVEESCSKQARSYADGIRGPPQLIFSNTASILARAARLNRCMYQKPTLTKDPYLNQVPRAS